MPETNVVKMIQVPKLLEEAFDFTTLHPTIDEVTRIREATLSGLLTIPAHATLAASDDTITIPQVVSVILNGTAISKDMPDHKTREPGINFEGRSGGKRRLRAKVSWQDGYYIVTVHSIKTIQRRSR